MATTSSHNKKSSAVKRILSEARELSDDPSTEYTASPLEDNIFEWHYTLRGPSSSEFEDGIYHGRIILPAEYPFRPPNVMVMTPNGRWEPNKKICLTFTGFHEEMWQPAWGIRTALLGVQAFMSARAEAAVGIGSLDYPFEERLRLARKSLDWMCPTCNRSNSNILPVAARKVEALPEGLSVDVDSERKHEAKKSAEEVTFGQISDSAMNATSPTQPQASLGQSFGPSGPSASFLASVAGTRAEESLQASSVSSSQVTTPGIITPRRQLSGDEVLTPSQARHRTPHDEASSRPTSSAGPSHDQGSSTALPASSMSSGSAAMHVAPLPEPVPVAPRPQTEPERTLATLDRAIATVVLLLVALLIRRLLHTFGF